MTPMAWRRSQKAVKITPDLADRLASAFERVPIKSNYLMVEDWLETKNFEPILNEKASNFSMDTL